MSSILQGIQYPDSSWYTVSTRVSRVPIVSRFTRVSSIYLVSSWYPVSRFVMLNSILQGIQYPPGYPVSSRESSIQVYHGLQYPPGFPVSRFSRVLVYSRLSSILVFRFFKVSSILQGIQYPGFSWCPVSPGYPVTIFFMVSSILKGISRFSRFQYPGSPLYPCSPEYPVSRFSMISSILQGFHY